jgi:hypothetical protein
MKAYIYSVQYVSSQNGYETAFDRGIMFAKSFTDVIKEVENEKLSNNDSIIDLYATATDKPLIHITEETYDKLINGEII